MRTLHWEDFEGPLHSKLAAWDPLVSSQEPTNLIGRASGRSEASDFHLGVTHSEEQPLELNLQDVAPTPELEAWLSETTGSVQRNAFQRHVVLAAGKRQRSSTGPQDCSHSIKSSRTLLW